MSSSSSDNRNTNVTENISETTNTNIALSDTDGINVIGSEGATVNVTDGGAIAAMAEVSEAGFDFASNIFDGANQFNQSSMDIVSQALNQVASSTETNAELAKNAIGLNSNLVRQTNSSESEIITGQVFSSLKWVALAGVGAFVLTRFK